MKVTTKTETTFTITLTKKEAAMLMDILSSGNPTLTEEVGKFNDELLSWVAVPMKHLDNLESSSLVEKSG